MNVIETPTPFAPEIVVAGRLSCLDGIRAVAIAMVLISHARASVVAAIPEGVIPNGIAAIWKAMGGLGVNLFFVLSGFLITHLLFRERAQTGRISLGRFYGRRALRILPAFAVYMMVIVGLNLAGILQVPWREVRAALFFYRDYLPLDFKAGYYVGHIWSLSVEEQFYLLWPPLLVVLNLRRARAFAGTAVVLMPLVRLGGYYCFHVHARGMIIGMFDMIADRLLWGSLLALFWDSPELGRVMMRFRSEGWLWGVALFYGVVDPLLANGFGGAYVLPVGVSLEALSCTFCIAWVLRNPDAVTSRALNLPWMVKLGVLSYSIYLWQQPFMNEEGRVWFQHFPTNLLGSLLLGSLSYYVVERRVLAWRDRLRT
jgi:peptidoglycan/LPS O-acetylase OafA/YrhL